MTIACQAVSPRTIGTRGSGEDVLRLLHLLGSGIGLHLREGVLSEEGDRILIDEVTVLDHTLDISKKVMMVFLRCRGVRADGKESPPFGTVSAGVDAGSKVSHEAQLHEARQHEGCNGGDDESSTRGCAAAHHPS